MAEEAIPEDVIRLLEWIEGYEQLEILLLLFGAPTQESTADAIAERLKVSTTDVESALDHLWGLQLCSSRGTGRERRFRYAPGPAAGDETLRRLVAAYDEQRLAIVQVMNAHAIERLRNVAIRTFADAFVVGRKKKDG